jgi:hypothetical protein
MVLERLTNPIQFFMAEEKDALTDLIFYEDKKVADLTGPYEIDSILRIAEKLKPVKEKILSDTAGKIIIKKDGEIVIEGFTKKISDLIKTLV